MSSNGLRRISIRGGKFHVISDGEEVTRDLGYMDVVIVNAAPVSRAYYGDAYDPNRVAVPTCWSPDTQVPSVDVPQDQRQSMRCMDCPQNIRGSGQYGGRACRFAQRLAVVFRDSPEEVYQLQIPATSIFGSTDNGDMGMQNYARLCFKPLERLDEDTIDRVSTMIDHEDTIRAITMSIPVTSEPVSPFGVVEGFEANAN
jgi:hypothetical protein